MVMLIFQWIASLEAEAQEKHRRRRTKLEEDQNYPAPEPWVQFAHQWWALSGSQPGPIL